MPQTQLTHHDKDGKAIYDDVLNEDGEKTGLTRPRISEVKEAPVGPQTALNPWSDGEGPDDMRDEEKAREAQKEKKEVTAAKQLVKATA
jgi:hypothetical protein